MGPVHEISSEVSMITEDANAERIEVAPITSLFPDFGAAHDSFFFITSYSTLALTFKFTLL